MNRAIPLRVPEDFSGDAMLYELDPPYDIVKGDEIERISHVVVSAVDLPTFVGLSDRDSETMVFPATDEGILDWGELAMVPFKSHSEALQELDGYIIAPE